MPYSIGEVAKMMQVPASTLRYYDNMGLFPNVRRENGRRVFEDKDFRWLRVLNCMKNINMPITKIKEYVELTQQGDNTLQARYELILEQKRVIEEEMARLQKCYTEFEYKEWYYQTAIAAGTEAVVEDVTSTAPTLEIDKIPIDFLNKTKKE